MFRLDLGLAYRWRLDRACALSDLVRSHTTDDGLVVALANGYDSGFSCCWSDGSRLLLDLFDHAFGSATGSVGSRARAAFEVARAGFPSRAAPLIEPDELGGGPGASPLVAASSGDHVQLTWLGEDGAALLRAGQTVARAAPHTLRERFRTELGPDELARLPDVLVQIISHAQPDARPEQLELDLLPGDTLILASRRTLDALPARLPESGAQALADLLVGAAFDGPTRPPYAAAAVLCGAGLARQSAAID